MSSSPLPHPAPTQRGFTLLEVLMAFAILAMLVTMVTQTWHQNMDKAGNAVSRREIREAGDTIFRRILYELQEHDDGRTGSLDEFYADWCGFKGYARERWDQYRFELRKRVKVAAGQSSDDDAEPLFGEGDEVDDQPFGEEDEGEEGIEGVRLTEVTIHIRREGEQEPLMTLRTYVRTPDTGQ